MDPLEIRAMIDQLCHKLDILNSSISALDARMAHQDELLAMRLVALERSSADQETRLRAATETVTRLTTSAGLAQVMQAAFAVILSAIAAYLGTR